MYSKLRIEAIKTSKWIKITTLALLCFLIFATSFACLIMVDAQSVTIMLQKIFTSTWFMALFVSCSVMLCISMHRFKVKTYIFQYIVLYLTLVLFFLIVLYPFVLLPEELVYNGKINLINLMSAGIVVIIFGSPLMMIIAKSVFCLSGKHHSWDGCVCTHCGQVKIINEKGHNWNGCICTICHEERPHEFGEDGYCVNCGECNHDWNFESSVETGYSEYGNNPYLHTITGNVTYRCSKCNKIRTDYGVVLEDTTE